MIDANATAFMHVSPLKRIELNKVWKKDPNEPKVTEYITPRHEHIWKCVTQIATSTGLDEERANEGFCDGKRSDQQEVPVHDGIAYSGGGYWWGKPIIR